MRKKKMLSDDWLKKKIQWLLWGRKEKKGAGGERREK